VITWGAIAPLFSMFRPLIALVLLCLLWEPIRPIRGVTAQALYTAGDLIAR
jgi:hypothetical protein